MVQTDYDVPYMQRTRDYYRAQGYEKDYVWAAHEDAPFCKPGKPLRQCRVGLITTAMPDTEAGRSKRQVYRTPSSPVPASMYTTELSWHKEVTHTDDVASFLPLQQLFKLAASGTIASVSPGFYSVPTEYSQRNTRENDAPKILEYCKQDEVDIAILVPL